MLTLLIFNTFSCILFFSSSSFLQFYFFFEISLIPVLLIILINGNQPERISAFFYLLLYTVLFSLPLLTFLFYLNSLSLLNISFFRRFSFLFVFLPFLVKLPLFIFHIWLPKAHVEAPTLGSIILAGLLLKLGGYGLCLFLFLRNTILKIYFIFISVLGSFLSCFIAVFQRDGKALVAFSRVCHLNFMFLLLLFSYNFNKVFNLITIIIHGITSRFLFWIIGTISHLSYSRNIIWIKSLKILSFSLFCRRIVLFSRNFGVPPLISFFQEIFFFSRRIFYSWILWVILIFYLILVCYFSLYLLINISLNSSLSFSRRNSMIERFRFLISLFIFNLFFLQNLL